jgi:hypothetical protein
MQGRTQRGSASVGTAGGRRGSSPVPRRGRKRTANEGHGKRPKRFCGRFACFGGGFVYVNLFLTCPATLRWSLTSPCRAGPAPSEPPSSPPRDDLREARSRAGQQRSSRALPAPTSQLSAWSLGRGSSHRQESPQSRCPADSGTNGLVGWSAPADDRGRRRIASALADSRCYLGHFGPFQRSDRVQGSAADPSRHHSTDPPPHGRSRGASRSSDRPWHGSCLPPSADRPRTELPARRRLRGRRRRRCSWVAPCRPGRGPRPDRRHWPGTPNGLVTLQRLSRICFASTGTHPTHLKRMQRISALSGPMAA